MAVGVRPRPSRWWAAATLAAGAVALAACSVPLPSLPQVEQASEMVRGGRPEAHRTCVGSAKDVEILLRCMQDRGYEFIARGPEYPAPECWQLRDAGDVNRPPPAYCFFRTRGPGGDGGQGSR